MTDITAFARAASDLDKDGFCEAHPYGFLILDVSEIESSNEWSFKTTTLSHSEIQAGPTMSTGATNLKVFPLIKAVGNPWKERISVGRARNNDIALTDHSVSKLHAYFTTNADGQTHVSDAGSRNGTKLRNDRLTIGRPERVNSGDQVLFGAILVTFVDGGGLYDLVAEYMVS